MGVFDFIRDVGAKVGIGESTGEKEAREAAEAAASDAAEQAEVEKREAAGKARIEAARARRKAAADAAADKKREEDRAQRAAHMAERRANAAKSRALETYLKGIGLHAADLDIRVDDGTAFIEGTVASQADREKIILAVGNVSGISKVDEEIEVVEPEPEATFHTVEKGDTLSKIAKEVYGDPMKYPVIFEANTPMLKDPDLIYPGQVLRIPAL